MNSFLFKVKSNFVAFIIFLILVASCCSAWYFWHPSSPYHKRYTFVVAFDAIGTLSPGNRVQVRGITKGEIVSVELTEDAVYVTARVLADTKIPVNSDFRLITAGLMGEREMCVLTGDSEKLIAEGDTLRGHFDEGTAGISANLVSIVKGFVEIKNEIRTFSDSLRIGSTGAQVMRVGSKANKLIRGTQNDLIRFKRDVLKLLDACDVSIEKIKVAINETGERGVELSKEADALLADADKVLAEVRTLKETSKDVFEKFDRDDNTLALVLDENGEFIRDLDKIRADLQILLQGVKKNGLKLNVDIF